MIITIQNVDKDWLLLITQAKEIGLSIEEIKSFLNNHKGDK